jgi:hypothetical protein
VVKLRKEREIEGEPCMGGGGKLKEQKDSDKWIARAEPSTIHLHYPQEWRMGLEAWSRKTGMEAEQSSGVKDNIGACESKTGNLAILGASKI